MLLTVSISILLSVFSTSVMSYITMATPIGPWIASTLVLIAMVLLGSLSAQQKSKTIALVTVAGSVGGIVATALGFSFPTLYFLNPTLFMQWMAHPFYFITLVGLLAAVGGWFGFWIANMAEHTLLVQEQLSYPVAELVHKMIAAQQQLRKAWELAIGFISTLLFCFLQDGIGTFKGFIPKSLGLVPQLSFSVVRIPALAFDIWPLLWAIGFVTGNVIALPLLCGALSKILIVDSLNAWLFPAISSIEFVLAFCSGMVLVSALQGLVETPNFLWKATRKNHGSHQTIWKIFATAHRPFLWEGLAVLFAAFLFFTYFKFTPITQLYSVIFTAVCAYQIAVIAGQIGLAQLGRFATFVMVPAMFLFNLDNVQVVFIATFVELSGGVAADILFGRKVGRLGNINPKQIKRYQYLGLVVSAVTAGVVFWLLINHFKLGSAELFAQRAQARQLLINVKAFNYYILAIGMIFGAVLKWMKMNPMLVLGGLLMPLNISIGLIVGGLLSMAVHNKEAWYPFWSGIFAGNSVWMLLKTVL